MNITDYLIDQGEHDWEDLLSEWDFLLPASFTVWMVNLLGDLIIVSDDASVSFVDIGIGTCELIARDREEFMQIVDVGENVNNWFAIPLVDKCRSLNKTLSRGECYGFKVPPVLGGEFEPENLEPTDLSVHYHLLWQIHKQTKELPDGTEVIIRVKDDV